MSFDGPVTTLRIRVVNGAVNVVGSPDPTTHLDISELSGRPLTVRREGSTLTVEYEEFSWQGLRRLIERGHQPAAVDAVHCPMGVAGVVGKEPAVIAVAVAAQLLQTRTV